MAAAALDVQAASKLLLEKALTLSDRNSDNASSLFKRLMQEVARLKEENELLREALASKESALLVVRSDLRMLQMESIREKEALLGQIEDLQAQLAAALAARSTAVETAVAAEAPARLGAAATPAPAAAAAAPATATFSLLSGPPLAVVSTLANGSLSGGGYGSGGGSGSSLEADSVLLIRIASLEKKLREQRAKQDELEAAVEAASRRAEEVEARASEHEVLVQREVALTTTNADLRAQLLSLMKGQETINMYLSLMLDIDPAISAAVPAPPEAPGAGGVGAPAGSFAASDSLSGSVGALVGALHELQQEAAKTVLADFEAARSEGREAGADGAADAVAAARARGRLGDAAIADSCSKDAAASAKTAAAGKGPAGEDPGKVAPPTAGETTLAVLTAPVTAMRTAGTAIYGAPSAAYTAIAALFTSSGAHDAASGSNVPAITSAQDVAKAAADAEAAEAAAEAVAVAKAVAASPWLAPLADRAQFVRYVFAADTAGGGEPSFVPVRMLQHRVFVMLWRCAQATRAQRVRDGAATAEDEAAAAEDGGGADVFALRLADLTADVTRELSRIPGLAAALEAQAVGGQQDALRLTGRLSEGGWDRAVAAALPAAHRGALLLLLSDRLRLEVGDLVIRLGAYADPASLLGSDAAAAIQEHLFVALAAQVWGVSHEEARAAVAASIAAAPSKQDASQIEAAAAGGGDPVAPAPAAAVAAAAAAPPAAAATAAAEAPKPASAASSRKASATGPMRGGQPVSRKSSSAEVAAIAAPAPAALAAAVAAAAAAAATAAAAAAAAAPAPPPLSSSKLQQQSAQPLQQPQAGMPRGAFSVAALTRRAFPAWGVLGAFAEFAPAVARGGVADLSGGAAGGGQVEVTLARWQGFFARRAAAASAPELLHLLVSLRRLLAVPAATMAQPAELTVRLLEEAAAGGEGTAAAEGKKLPALLRAAGAAPGGKGFSLASVAGAIGGDETSGECAVM